MPVFTQTNIPVLIHVHAGSISFLHGFLVMNFNVSKTTHLESPPCGRTLRQTDTLEFVSVSVRLSLKKEFNKMY